MKTKKYFAVITLVAFLVTLLPIAALASTVTAFTAAGTSTLPGDGSVTYTLTVTNNTELATGDEVKITFPAGFDLTGATANDDAAGKFGGADAGTIDGQTVTYAASATVAAGTATAFEVTNVVNSNKQGAQDFSVITTKDADATTAAVTLTATAGNEFTTTVAADKETVDADNDSTVKYTVYVYDKFYNPVNGATVYFASSRGAADTFVQSGSYTITPEGGNVYSVTTTNDGKAEVKVKSLVAGNAKVGFALANPAKTIYDYLLGDANASAGTIQVIKTKDVNFTADSSTQNVSIPDVTLRDRTADINITPAGTGAQNDPYGPASTWGKANDLDFYTINVKVTNAQGTPVANEEVQFSVDDENARLSASKITTDGSGFASVKLYAKKAGKYVVSYKTSSSTSKEVYISFDPAEVSTIVLKSENNRVIAKDTKPSWKFEVRDTNGNKIDIISNSTADTTISSIDSVEKPEGASIKKDDFNITADLDSKVIKIQPKNAFNKVGNYQARVTLNNGQYAEIAWIIKAQGEIVDLKLVYPQSSLPLNANSGTPTVTWVDAEGVEKDADSASFNSEGIKFSASDYTKINGSISAATGAFTTTSQKDYSGELVITAYDNNHKLSASYTITLAKDLARMEIDAHEQKATVGDTVSVPVKFVDVDGTVVAVGNVGGTGVTVKNAYAVSKPADSIVTIEEANAFGKEIQEKGQSNIYVKSTKAGTVKVFVAVDVNGAIYADTFEIEFSAAKPEVGAKNVTMFIGSTGYVVDGVAKVLDVAPFIQDNRTFVPIRMVGEALGAEVEWDEAAQTVTIERADKTITMTIGSNVLTVNDGSTIVSDVAPFITDSRTVLPFRVIGEAFGAEVEAVFAADGTTSAVTYAQ